MGDLQLYGFNDAKLHKVIRKAAKNAIAGVGLIMFQAKADKRSKLKKVVQARDLEKEEKKLYHVTIARPLQTAADIPVGYAELGSITYNKEQIKEIYHHASDDLFGQTLVHYATDLLLIYLGLPLDPTIKKKDLQLFKDFQDGWPFYKDGKILIASRLWEVLRFCERELVSMLTEREDDEEKRPESFLYASCGKKRSMTYNGTGKSLMADCKGLANKEKRLVKSSGTLIGLLRQNRFLPRRNEESESDQGVEPRKKRGRKPNREKQLMTLAATRRRDVESEAETSEVETEDAEAETERNTEAKTEDAESESETEDAELESETEDAEEKVAESESEVEEKVAESESEVEEKVPESEAGKSPEESESEDEPLDLEKENFGKVYVFTSGIPGAGRGLFAAADFEKGDAITQFPGKFRPYTDKVPTAPEHPYTIAAPTGYIISPATNVKYSTLLAHMANDAKDDGKNNSVAQYQQYAEAGKEPGGIFLVATQNIATDEEIFLDYGWKEEDWATYLSAKKPTKSKKATTTAKKRGAKKTSVKRAKSKGKK